MSFIYRGRDDSDYAIGWTPPEPKKETIVYLKSLDGSEIDDSQLLAWFHLSLDTHFIKAWYKNGQGYFVKFHDSDVFVKVERSLV